jgi:endonuclease YncB( thermonuclease family)
MAFASAAVLVLVLAAGPGPVEAEASGVSGRAIVIDGDTIEIDGTRIRLEGIDAPESAQTCPRRSLGTWACGTEATATLETLIGTSRVDCESRGRDRYRRVIGQCRAQGQTLNEAMVRAGMAWAFVKYSETYVAAEAAARATGAGIWQAEAEPAWVFREKHWRAAEASAATAPPGCVIKGNISSNGQIYFMPWSSWYGRVKVDLANGERWFCSEAEAQEAGWRAALTH